MDREQGENNSAVPPILVTSPKYLDLFYVFKEHNAARIHLMLRLDVSFY